LTGIQALDRDHADLLPLAPCWRIDREYALGAGAGALASELASLAGQDEHYWVLQQGPLAPGSKRQSLLNLDSDVALAAALGQTFSREDGPQSLVFQCMPPQRAAGVLFTRHPMRPDLEHIVIEGCLGGTGAQQRLILHADGQLAWQSADAEAFLDEVGTAAFHQLAENLNSSYGEPRAAEWIWDGRRLWLVQALPIGTLPMPSEVWTRRAGLGFSPQAITPMWYTMLGRWLKEGFWRRIGQRAGWRELGNVEPYRRQHSYLYGNSRFFRALQGWQGGRFLDWALPPAWRAQSASPPRQAGRWSRLRLTAQLHWLQWRFSRLAPTDEQSEPDEIWLSLIRLDKLGERLSAVEGQLGYMIAPTRAARGSAEAAGIDPAGARYLASLAGAALGSMRWEHALAGLSRFSVGTDPVFPRFDEAPAEVEQLRGLLPGIAPARLEAMQHLPARATRDPWLRLRGQAHGLRQTLASSLRRLLRIMARRLVARRLIRHPDDVFFLYFDELWQAWQGQTRRQLETLLGERKVRYLSDAHAGPPDWIIDSVGYGTSPLGQTNAHDTVHGYGLVSGQVSGRVQRLGSGWQLNQVQAGDILVMDQSDPGWLPWIACAGALVMAHRDPLDPAVGLALALGIPAVWGVDDAMHCLPDGIQLSLDGDTGHLRHDQQPASAEQGGDPSVTE